MTTKLLKLSGLAVAAVVSLTLASTAILSSAHAQPSGGGAVHAAKHHHARHHHGRRHARGIPQHNGGDHDSDNNGGPSDGDGNI
ncbi:MAG: hypothetical protein ACJ768_16255 [Gaiellaceae bacterium]